MYTVGYKWLHFYLNRFNKAQNYPLKQDKLVQPFLTCTQYMNIVVYVISLTFHYLLGIYYYISQLLLEKRRVMLDMQNSLDNSFWE